MGWPTRISRSALGPRPLKNRYPVRDHERELGAELVGLAWWQLAGLNVVGERAWALVRGADGQLLDSGEVWDPDALVVPTTSRTSTGIYVVEYAATYPDDQGNAITLDLRAAEAAPQTATPNTVATCNVSSSRIVTVRVTLANTGALVDADVLVKAR